MKLRMWQNEILTDQNSTNFLVFLPVNSLFIFANIFAKRTRKVS